MDLSTADALLTGEDASDDAGSSLGNVDHDGDGVVDLLVGAKEEDTWTSTSTGSGAVGIGAPWDDADGYLNGAAYVALGAAGE